MGKNKVNNNVEVSDFFIGKLVKKGIYLNYVIEEKDPSFSKDMIELNWKDEFSVNTIFNIIWDLSFAYFILKQSNT